MCNNLKPYIGKKVSGYKVVAEKNGRYYSPAMGIRYHNGKLVKIPKKQNRITTNFNKDILTNKNSGYRPLMVGRTAIFIRQDNAESARDCMKRFIREGYTAKVVPATVLDDLLIGDYGYNIPVVAGKRITF